MEMQKLREISGRGGQKYTEKERQTAIDLYLESCGFRRIARILSGIFNRQVCYQTVIQWIKKRSKKDREFRAKKGRKHSNFRNGRTLYVH